MQVGYTYILKSLTFGEAIDVPECEHEYEAVVTAPDCVNGGYTTYTCSICGESYVADETAALGHKWDDGVVTKEPTKDEEGVKTFTCSVCGETKTESIPKLPPEEHEHDYTAVVTAPTCTDKGFTTYTCACGHSYVADEVAALGHDFKDGVCTVCGEKEEHVCPSKDFADIPALDNWAHAGIDYAVANGLMKGTGGDKFSPKGTLTRAELVTILYRAAGEPDVEFAGVFTDVADDQWFSAAIEWAAANKIVNGIGNGKFDPTGVITREQIATMLYRYAGEPVVEGKLDAFPDAASVQSFAEAAMVWATSNGIITGATKDGVTYLAPQDDATREQIASIVMRYLELDK